jgi:hypothetical protein
MSKRALATRILDECADLYREPQHREWAIARAVELLNAAAPPTAGHTYGTADKCVFCGSHRVNGGPCVPPKTH